MVDKGVLPNNRTYNNLIYEYSSMGQWKEVVRVFKKMTSQGILPNVVTLKFEHVNGFPMQAWKIQGC